jgi:hypothetical protein
MSNLLQGFVLHDMAHLVLLQCTLVWKTTKIPHELWFVSSTQNNCING